MQRKVKNFVRVSGDEVEYNNDAHWLKELKDECGETRHDDIMIIFALVAARAKKISKLKAPRTDGVKGY